MLAEPIAQQTYIEVIEHRIRPLISPVGRSRRGGFFFSFFFFPGAHEWLLIRPSKMSLSSICCLDGMQIHHNVLAPVSSCSGSLNCGTEATESG